MRGRRRLNYPGMSMVVIVDVGRMPQADGEWLRCLGCLCLLQVHPRRGGPYSQVKRRGEVLAASLDCGWDVGGGSRLALSVSWQARCRRELPGNTERHGNRRANQDRESADDQCHSG